MQELNLYAAWIAKQSAKGVAATSGHRRLNMVGGDMDVTRDMGSEAYSDLDVYGAQTDFINSLTGTGSPVFQGTPEELAFLFYLMEGGETTLAVTGPPAKTNHVIQPLPSGGGFWFTLWKRVGASQIQRQRFVDCFIQQMVLEASSSQKVMRVTPQITSLSPAEVYGTDPSAALPTVPAFIWTEAAGKHTIDGAVYAGATQSQITWNLARELVYGDDAVAYDRSTGQPALTLASSVYMDQQGLENYNRNLYGTPTPAADAKPRRLPSAIGSYVTTFQQRSAEDGALTGNELKITVPGVRWELPNNPAPNPSGGAAELPLAGSMRKLAGQPAYKVEITCGAAAFT